MKYIIVPMLLTIGCGNPQAFVTRIEGTPGASCSVVETTHGATISCPGSPDVHVNNGNQGASGSSGSSGVDGVSCSVVQVASGDSVLPNGGAVVTCGTNVALVANGTDGDQGVAGVAGQDAPVNPYSVTEVINPCGPQSSYDEVLLALGDGSLVALFTANIHGDYSRLSLIPDGSYITTDLSACSFNVSTVGNTRTVSWTGGSKSWTF